MTAYVEPNTHTVPFKNSDDHVTSTNKHVVALCSSVREGTSKLTNKLYYLYLKNKRRGVNYVLISLETLKKELNRSEDSIRLYIAEGIEAGLIIVEKIRDKFHKLRYKFILTAKLLQIKQCGTVAEDHPFEVIPKTVPNFYTQKPKNSAKMPKNSGNTPPFNPLFSAGLKEVSEPLYLGISLKRLNMDSKGSNQTAIELLEPPLSSFEEEQPNKPQKEEMEFLTGVQELNQNLPKPHEVNVQSVLKAYRTLKKSHFGEIGEARKYLEGFSNTPFAMGKKPTKSGDIFNATIGYILSPKTIEQYWEKKGIFNVWPPKEAKQSAVVKQETKAGLSSASTSAFSLSEALQNAKNGDDRAIKEQLYNSLGASSYLSWIHKTGFIALGLKDGQPEFFIESIFARDYLTTHYREQLKGAFACIESKGEKC